MTYPRLLTGLLTALLLALPVAAQAPPPGMVPVADKAGPGDKEPARKRLPVSGLAPSKLVPNLCVLRYPVSTTSSECQAFFDQGLGYFYSYVWMEAVRSFETATQLDPQCAMAHWGLYRALIQYGKRDEAMKALLKADSLKEGASVREQQLILASMFETGNAPNSGDGEARKKKAIQVLDNMLATYDDDTEGWYFRAQLAGGAGGFGGEVAAVPYYKALLLVDPLHPGANHELLHFYEKYQRPALGWVPAENYIKSSPGIPHAFHMQAHLATRLGRWDRTSDRSARAIELERAYHKEMNVRPQEDPQYAHHLETLLTSLIHDGRFAEAREIKREQEACNLKPWNVWFSLHLAERDWKAAFQVVDHFRKSDKTTASYYAALIYLKQGDAVRALPEIEVLQQATRDRRADRRLEARLWEVQGLYQCQTGAAESGLKLLQRLSDRTKNDYSHHAWGNGAIYMEQWGVAALGAGRDDVAEEAYLEALAHDPGSVRAALGMELLCELHGRTEEAARFADLARRCWGRADSSRLEAERTALRTLRNPTPVTGATSAP